MGLEVLAEQFIAAAAVEAGAAKLGVIGDDALADLEVLNLGANGSDDTDGLMAGDERELEAALAMLALGVWPESDIPLR